MSQFRVYFFDLETRKELTDFQFNGKTWLGTSGGKHIGNGEFDKTVCTHVDVANYADLSTIKGEKRVTWDDFKRDVAVKIWYGPNNIEWRKLIKE